MAAIHHLITGQGIETARKQAQTASERVVVEAAYKVLSQEHEEIGFTYSGFALTCLPHKQQEDTLWKREGHNLTLILQSGVDRTGKQVGVPYGSYARSSCCTCSRRPCDRRAGRWNSGGACKSGWGGWGFRSAAIVTGS